MFCVLFYVYIVICAELPEINLTMMMMMMMMVMMNLMKTVRCKLVGEGSAVGNGISNLWQGEYTTHQQYTLSGLRSIFFRTRDFPVSHLRCSDNQT